MTISDCVPLIICTRCYSALFARCSTISVKVSSFVGLGVVISERLVMFRLTYQDFSRQLKGLDKLNLWKASEFKPFQFYGFLTFLDYMHPNVLAHFFVCPPPYEFCLGKPTMGKSVNWQRIFWTHLGDLPPVSMVKAQKPSMCTNFCTWLTT